MKPVKLDLPDGVEVRGELLSGRQPDCMLQDLLELKLPTGITIDVGWHPESDPNGSYRVVVFRDYWRNQLQQPVLTRSIRELVTIVEKLAREYSGPGRTTVFGKTNGGPTSRPAERELRVPDRDL